MEEGKKTPLPTHIEANIKEKDLLLCSFRT